MKFYVKNFAAMALCFGLVSIGHAQNGSAVQTPEQPRPAEAPAPVAPAALPTPSMTGPLSVIGAEYTFTFESMNIVRGLLWNQETAISRGIQVNQTMGKVTASLSWNDGFYSNRYSWLSGSLNLCHMPWRS